MKNVSILFLGLALAASSTIQCSESRVPAQKKSSVESQLVKNIRQYTISALTVCAAIISMATAANSENPS
jgi:hypothetical protein